MNVSDIDHLPVANQEPRALVIELLVTKGYLKTGYPLTAHNFYPALVEALEAAPAKVSQ